MKYKPLFTFLGLSLFFLIYSFSIYLTPLINKNKLFNNNNKAIDGHLVWQKYNCQSCHQLYGLGGYLGPDLTNIISTPNKGEKFLRLMIRTGIKQMPSFNLSENEIELLVEFLKSTDASGISDPRHFNINNIGMIE